MATTAIKKRVRDVTVDEKIRDHADDPFVAGKVESAKRLIRKYGLPKKMK